VWLLYIARSPAIKSTHFQSLPLSAPLPDLDRFQCAPSCERSFASLNPATTSVSIDRASLSKALPFKHASKLILCVAEMPFSAEAVSPD
jgi:hypothetical protein